MAKEVQTVRHDTLLAVHLALLAVQLSFSGFHVVGKAVLETFPPMALATTRVLIATPLLIGLAWLKDRRLPARRHLPWLALLGLLGVYLNQILFVIGLKFTTATNAAILMPSIPVFAVGIGWLTRVESIARRKLLGVLLAAGGAVTLLDPRNFSLHDASALGTLLILLNCLSYATFLVLQRPLLEQLPWRTVIAWAFLFGGLAVTLTGGSTLAAVEPSAIAPGVWLGVLYIGLVPTFLGYLLNTWAVRRSSATLAATYTTLQPLLTAVLAWIVLGETLGAPQIIGFLLIATGLWLVSWRCRPALATR
jgi:drug/metabolite transporter (DMT)-like permease